MKSLLEFKVDPIIIDSKTKKAVLICVDEFSLLTNAIEKKWEPQQQKDFLNRINNEKIPFQPFRQFLFKGVQSRHGQASLTFLCNPAFYVKDLRLFSSRPLLEKIVKLYGE